jgi:hypothetical protein
MADNFVAKDGSGATFTIRATDVGSGVYVPHYRHSDGTNLTPTMDAVSRPGFFKLTDGTNTAPTMDAAARPGYVTPVATTTGGCSQSHTISATSTNGTNVKASAGTVYGIQVCNLNAAARYLKLYNTAGVPTVGTDTPVKVIEIPPASSIVVPVPAVGLAFSTGIGFGLTSGIADNNTGAVSASEHLVEIDYK